MDDKTSVIQDFFNQLWSFAVEKHKQGVFNTVCLAILLALPLLVFLTMLGLCCHCCCGRRGGRAAAARSQVKKKKTSANAEEDLWISVKTGPTTPDRVALTTM